MSELDEDTRRVWYQKGYHQAERNTSMAYELLKEALGALESEHEGTNCHQELIERIRELVASNDKK